MQAGLKYIRKTLAQGDTHLDVLILFYFSSRVSLFYIDLILSQPNPNLNPDLCRASHLEGSDHTPASHIPQW